MNKELDIVVLLTGQNEGDEDIYVYLKLEFSKLLQYNKTLTKGKFDYEKLGKVLYEGKGKEPPEDIKAMMKDKYGTIDDFDKLLLEFFEGSD